MTAAWEPRDLKPEDLTADQLARLDALTAEADARRGEDARAALRAGVRHLDPEDLTAEQVARLDALTAQADAHRLASGDEF